MKSYQSYLDTTAAKWEQVKTDVLSGQLSYLTLAEDLETGDYTRLTKFSAGCRTSEAKVHSYPEEVYIVSGRVYDEAFALYLEAGYYASRPPHEKHGPFYAEEETLVLEVSYPSILTAVPKDAIVK